MPARGISGPDRPATDRRDVVLTDSILIVDDHPLFRQALSVAVAAVRPDARLLEAGTLARAVAIAAEADNLALILLDLKMPGAVGYSGVALLHAERPSVPILVVSSADAAMTLRETRRFGAIGFLGKDAELTVIEAAVSAALDGSMAMDVAVDPTEVLRPDDRADRIAALTPTQLKVLLGVMNGSYNKQIAFDLGISEATVRAHMTAVLRKLDVTSRTQAVLAARGLGL